jgi:3-hydroxyisobutyrate dehydrogenase-like beta-hydroxyacid dehydrogenase
LRGVSLIDVAPLSGQCDSIDKPVAWLCGGAKGAVERVRPLIEAISSTVIHCGPTGSARLAELVVTAAAVCNRAIVYENAHTGLEFGLEPGAMAVALNEGSGWSAEGAIVLKSLSTAGTTTRVTLRAMLEEMNELIGLASAKNAPLFIPGMVRTLVEAELARFGPGATLDALARPPCRFER